MSTDYYKMCIALFSVFASAIIQAKADEAASIKTNLLYDLGTTITLGAEAGIDRHFSIDVMGAYNPWTFSKGVKFKHWLLQPELRWWPGERMNGHFLGVHLIGGEYNLNRIQLPYDIYPSTLDYRYEGWGVGGGIAYGYRWNFNRRWAMEGSVGVGVIHSSYDRYTCGDCGERIGSGTKAYVGPTKLALSLIYRFGAKEPRKPRVETVERIVERLRVDTVYITREVPMRDTLIRNLTDTIRERQKVIHADYALRLVYPLSSSRIDPMLGDNAARIDSLMAFIDRYADDPMLRISSIDIVGYSSLEGGAARNLTLSEDRARAAADLIESLRPELAHLIYSQGKGEDWDSVDFPGKRAIMADPDLDSRERCLRAIGDGSLFRSLLATKLPQTRRIECVINYTRVTTEIEHLKSDNNDSPTTAH